jgi:hypothetical protein
MNRNIDLKATTTPYNSYKLNAQLKWNTKCQGLVPWVPRVTDYGP